MILRVRNFAKRFGQPFLANFDWQNKTTMQFLRRVETFIFLTNVLSPNGTSSINSHPTNSLDL